MIPVLETEDDLARERIRHSLQESLIVEAAAGTGKTTELVRRMVNVLRHGLTTIDRVVAVTFTNKAAGELKLRLRQELDQARQAGADATDAAHLEHALAHLEEAAIGTIHAFCAQILRERPVEASVDPDFEELDDPGARRVYGAVFRRWLQEKLNQDAPGLRRALARLAADTRSEYTPLESLQSAGWALLEWRDFPQPWSRPPLAREEVLDQLAEYITGLAPELGKFKPKDIEPVRDALPWAERTPRDYDMLEGFLFRIGKAWRSLKSPPSRPLLTVLENFRVHADADLAAMLREEMWELVGLYEAAKRRAGQLDFLDLLLLVRNLLRSNETVRAYLQQRFTHLFVDEFQDTDPLQAEILLLLSAASPGQRELLQVTPAPGKLFLVGDPKQSIYKFRRADVGLYQMVRAMLTGRGVGLVRLSRSYRSVRGIQECVNAAFAPEMTGSAEAAQAEYVPLEQHRPDLPGQPAVVALPAPYPHGFYGVTNKAINECLPAAIIGFAAWMLESSGWQVSDPETREPRALAPRDVCILFRRFTNYGADLTRDYVRSLEDRGIPHLLVGSKSFHAREEIETMRAALTAVEWPEDELAVFAALKGALFAVPDHLLLRFRHEHGGMHPFRAWPDEVHADYQPLREVLELLKEAHLQRNRRPVAETVYRLLEAARAWAAFAARPAGNQVLANVRRVLDLARQFESRGGYSFRGFVEELAALADKAESSEAPVLEDGAEGVRLMTVHAAKGLEFPVVLLADMTANLCHENADRYVEPVSGLCAMRLLGSTPLELKNEEDTERQREAAEGVRVAYVAATRARDLLVVPVVGDSELEKSWIGPLFKAVYPEAAAWRKAAPFAGVPLGPDSVLGRDTYSVQPGWQRARAGGHSVLWWDPAALPESREERFGQRQKEIFADDAAALQEGQAAYQAWQKRRDEALRGGSAPAVQVAVASRIESPPTGPPVAVLLTRCPRTADRPTGKRFGELVHAALRDVPLDAGREQIAATVKLHARILGAEDDERQTAAFAVRTALLHPLLDRARAARRVYREHPVTHTPSPGQVVEGVIDLAFEEDGHWIVVDFKTDSGIDELVPQYQAQLAWYVRALQAVTGRPVQAYLLAV